MTQEAEKSKEQEAAEMRAQVRKDYTLPPAWSETEDYLQIYAEWYAQQREQPGEGWIKVSDRFPPINKIVLVINKYWVGVGKYLPDEDKEFPLPSWQDEASQWIEPAPTHWQKLPPPPSQQDRSVSQPGKPNYAMDAILLIKGILHDDVETVLGPLVNDAINKALKHGK